MSPSNPGNPAPPVTANLSPQGSVPNFVREIRVEEHDLDRSGVAVLSMYPRWMEETEYAFLRTRGLSVSLTDERGRYGFPRTRVEWKIQSPARRGDELRISLWLGETDGKRLRYRFGLERTALGDVGGALQKVWEPCAQGEFLMACCRFPAEALPYAIPIPQRVLEGLGLEPQTKGRAERRSRRS